jgi:hypothetical protein
MQGAKPCCGPTVEMAVQVLEPGEHTPRTPLILGTPNAPAVPLPPLPAMSLQEALQRGAIPATQIA